MPSQTRYFGIGFFDFGDDTGIDFNVQVEIDRFVFLDKELFGLMSIFGNGVVNGWTVAAETAFSISISEGYGNIDFKSGKTTFPFVISKLPQNSTLYIYAKAKTRTTFTEEVDFIFDSSATLAENDFNFLLLAKVSVGNTSIELVDNSVRQEIGFIETIKAAIKLHKHRGGSLNPSKIDLGSEVKGQLPSFRIADFDAEKITSGTFDLARMPLLDHQDLQNVGLLTHPQLDSFVKTLQGGNTELFGEIGTANLLQLIIAAKLIYEDVQSVLYSGVKIDENMINELVVIPGITSNDFIDFDNTTAEVDLDQHFIRGVPPTTGTSFYVNYDTGLAWKAQTLDNLVVIGDTVALDFDPDQEATTKIIEGFESSTEPNQDLTQSGLSLFSEQNIVLVDSAVVQSNASSTNTTQGFYSGQFKHQQTFRVQFVKEFAAPQNWTDYDLFALQIKCLSQIHGSVKLYFKNSQDEKSPDFSLLDEDEVTNQFETRSIDLTTITFRDNIKSITIYSDDHVNDFVYYIDNMHIEKAVLLPSEGTMSLKYSAGSSVIFSTLEWNTTEPPGTEIQVRARAANGTVLLNRATFTNFLSSGNNLNLEGTDLEVEFTFLPDSTKTVSPVLNSARILILTEAEIDGFSIDTSDEFSRGSFSNAAISDNTVHLDTPIYVDSVYFALQNGVHQGRIVDGIFTSGSEPTILGTKDTPIAPNQVFAAVENSQNSVSESLFEVRSARRQTGRNFVVADTFNDRVLEFNEAGDLISGVGSINYEANTIFPIAASIDLRTNILYVVWSKKISFKTVNVSKMIIQSSGKKVQLIKDFDKILGFTTTELQKINAEGQIMPVVLSIQNTGLVQNLPKTETFLKIDGSKENGVLPGGIDQLSILYTTAASGLGISCYVGNFAYIDGIFTPTYVDKSLANGFIITNGTIAVKTYNFSNNPKATGVTVNKIANVSSIIEIDKNNNIVFGSNVMNFSPFIPGRVVEIDKTTLLIGGTRPGGESGTPDASSPLDFRAIFGDDANINKQKSTLSKIFFGSTTKPHVGSMVLYDKSVQTIIFEYISPEGILVSDVDIDNSGNYVIAESSLNRSGRIIKLDTNGNIVFSYGEGTFSLINDVRVQIDDSMIIST